MADHRSNEDLRNVALETRSHFTSKYERMMAEEKRRLGRVQAEKRRELQEQLRKPPTVFLSEANQQFILGLLKDQSEEVSQPVSTHQTEKLREELIQLGFPEEAAKEAAQKCDTLSACLDWCCVHLPDQQLPLAFRAAGKQLDVIHGRKENHNSAVRFLVDCGFSPEDVQRINQSTSDLEKCLSELTGSLLHTHFDDSPSKNDLVETEIEALKAIFNQDENTSIIQQITFMSCSFLRYQCTVNTKPISLWVALLPLFAYPKRPPIVYLHCGQIPDKLRLAFTCVVYESYTQNCEGVLYEVLSDVEQILQKAMKRVSSIPDDLIQIPSSKKKSTLKPINPASVVPESQTPTPSKPHKSIRHIPKNGLFGNPTAEVVAQRRALPIASYREKILNMVRENQVCLLNGGTGCGKSTQVPQFLLEEFRESQASNLNIVVCEPRRISCLGLYNRVIEEQGFEEGAFCPIGYQVRGDSK